MNVSMDSQGVITIRPDNDIESYAMKHWVGQSLVNQQDLARGEQCHWRGSKLIAITEVEK